MLEAEAWVPFVANPESPQTRLDRTLPGKATDTRRMKTEVSSKKIIVLITSNI